MTVYFQQKYHYYSDSSSEEDESYAEKLSDQARAAQLVSSGEKEIPPSQALQGRVKSNWESKDFKLSDLNVKIENQLYNHYKKPKLKDLNPSNETLLIFFEMYLNNSFCLSEKDKKWLLNQEARIRATQNKDFINKFEKFKASVCPKPTLKEAAPAYLGSYDENETFPPEPLQGRVKPSWRNYETILKDLNPSDETLLVILDIYLKNLSCLSENDKKWLLNQEARIRATQNKDFIKKFEKFKASVCPKSTDSEKKT